MANYLPEDEVFGNSKKYLSSNEVFGEAGAPEKPAPSSILSDLSEAPAAFATSALGATNSGIAGAARFAQAPIANAKAMAMAIPAFFDKQLPNIGARVDDAQTASDVQGAQAASAEATEARDRNVAAGGVASFLRSVEESSNRAANTWQGRHDQWAPGITRQGQEVESAKGLIGTAAAMATHPLDTLDKVAQSLPDMLLGMGAGKIAGSLARLQKSMAGASAALADTAAVRAAGEVAALSEGASSVLRTQQQTSEFVKRQSPDDLAKNSPRYRELLQSNSPEQSRSILAEELGNESALPAGAWTYGMNKLSGSGEAIGKTVAGTEKMTGKEFAKRTGSEALDEALQNPGENYAQYAAQVQADPKQEYDFGGSLAQGIISGGVMGAGSHGAGYLMDRLPGRGQAGSDAPSAPGAAPTPESQESTVASQNPASAPLFTEAQASAVTAFAEDRLTAIEAKVNGTADHAVEGPDGSALIVTGEKPQSLTSEEAAERDFLSANIGDHEALANAYGIDPKEIPTVAAEDAPIEPGGVKASAETEIATPGPAENPSPSSQWSAFAADTGTLGIPRADMPQIQSEHRGAMVNFMKARDVSSQQEEVPADSLRPSQSEYSVEKVRKATDFAGNDRSILASSDNYILDGHHQWLAKRNAGQPIKILRLDAPIKKLIPLAHEFPSSTVSKGAAAETPSKKTALSRAIAPERDSLFMAVAKLGGMSTEELTSNGVDKASISKTVAGKVSKATGKLGKQRQAPLSMGFNLPLHKAGGLSFDSALEQLKQYGYFSEGATKNDMINAFNAEVDGQPHYAATAHERMAKLESESRDAEMRAEQDLVDAERAAERAGKDNIGYDDMTPEQRAAIDEIIGLDPSEPNLEQEEYAELQGLLSIEEVNNEQRRSDEEGARKADATATRTAGRNLQEGDGIGQGQSQVLQGTEDQPGSDGQGREASGQGHGAAGLGDKSKTLDAEYRAKPQKVINRLMMRGKVRELFDAAGVRNTEQFKALPIDGQAAAYVKMSGEPGFNLEQQTDSAIAEKLARENDTKTADRARLKAESEAAPGAFALQPEEKPKAMVEAESKAKTGDMFTPPTAESGSASPDRAAIEKADADFESALNDFGDILGGNFKANFTPEQEQKIIPVLTRLMDAAFRKGYYKFKEAARFVLDSLSAKFGKDLADQITLDHLQGAYIGMAGRYKGQGADSAKAVVSIESKMELENVDVTDKRSSADLERNRRDAETQDGVGEDGLRAGRDGDGRTGRQGVEGAEGNSGERGSIGSREDKTAAAGERGNQQIYTGASEPTPGSAGNNVDLGSSDGGIDGLPVEPAAAVQIENLARSDYQKERDRLAQSRADKLPQAEGLAAIKAALPILSEGQQEDVSITEARFAVPDGYGMLFTNGTGTGKTFSGLGVIKRFASAGKQNILIVAPNDEIIVAWQKAGKMLGLDLSRLADTNDAGNGIVITTYANMGANDALAAREWDLVVHDEAHYLAMDKDGTATNALRTLRAITKHPDGVHTRAEMLNRDLIAEISSASQDAKLARMSDDQRDWPMGDVHQKRADAASAKYQEARRAVEQDVSESQGEKRPRALFLSATPFAYEKTVDWANGYIFDYNTGRASEEGEFRGYNQGSNREQFFMQNFGYRMRTGKLTEPDAKVDRGVMQRQFNTMLKKSGALAGRMLDVKADYDRRFILVDSAIGQRIDEALQWFEAKRKAKQSGTGDVADRIGAIMAKADPYVSALNAVRDTISEKFDYLSRRYLLESIKAHEVVPHIREHLAMGRKVVVFHDYKKGGGFNPFILGERAAVEKESEDANFSAADWNEVVHEFNAEFRDIINSDPFKQSSPIDMFKAEFPGVLLFNGDVPTKARRANVAKFQDDASGPQVLLVQSAAGKEGISLHDTTGKHQRVLFNLGQPTQPTTAIQQEGRIYRTGQVTDAIFRYLNTGTNWEKWAFATTIAARASAAENLGMGEQARALKDAFITGFEESGDYRAGMEGEGKGGKGRDKAANNALTEYDRARAFYFGQQKKTARTKAQEGADYFATPEPVGLKMVELADIRPGEDALEPSAGHGAIARWIPDTAEKTAIEPSMALRPRLAMVFDGKILDHDFEGLNVVNKYDAIVMNPPFGSAGRTAIDHLAKAAMHLRDGGRIVALIPTGPSADKKFEKWMYGEETRNIKPMIDHPAFGNIFRGDVVTTRASWMPEGKVTRKDKDGNLWLKAEGQNSESVVSPSAWTGVKSKGPSTETYSPSKGFSLVADIAMPGVTFERAGTQVMTRIVVIEKSDSAPQQTSRDYSNETDINALFDRMETLEIKPRSKAREAIADAAEAPERKSKPVVDKAAAQAAAQAAGLEIIEHTTGKGKVIRGVVRKDLTKTEAKEIDEFTFPKNGGFFIREKHLVQQPVETKFSRQNGLHGVTREQIAPIVATFKKEFPGAKVVVLENESDPRTPQSLRDAIEEADAVGDVAGAFHKGTTYLFRDSLSGPDHARATLAHEGVHNGLADLGVSDETFKTIAASNPKLHAEARKIRAQYGYTFARSIEEAMADMGDRARNLNGWKRIISAVRDKLRKAGLISDWSDNDVEAFALRALSTLKTPKATTMFPSQEHGAAAGIFGAGSEGAAAFSRASQRAAQAALSPMQKAKAKVDDLLSDEMRDSIIYSLQNKVIDLKRVQERIDKLGTVINEVSDAYQAEEVYLSRLTKRIKSFAVGEEEPLLKAMHDNEVAPEVLEQFLHARHAPERNAEMAKRNPNQKTIDAEQGRVKADLKAIDVKIGAAKASGASTNALENTRAKIVHEWQQWSGVQAFHGTEDERNSLSGMSDAAAKAHLDSLSSKERAILDSLAARIDRIQAKTHQALVEHGLESRETVAGWKKQYQFYVPLHRDDAHPATGFGNGTGQGFSVKGSSAKKATGSNAEVTDILAHILMNRHKALTRGEKNRVAQRLYLLAKSNPDKDFWTTGNVTKRVLNKFGFVEAVVDPMHASRDNVLMVRAGGKDLSITFNEANPNAMRLVGALKNADAVDLGKIERRLAKATRWFASVNTQYNPIFGLINLARDAQDAVLNLSTTEIADRKAQVVTGILPALKAIYGVERKGKPLWGAYKPDPKWAAAYEEFEMAGGATGYMDMFASAEEQGKALIGKLKALDRGDVVKAIVWMGDALSGYNTAMENATRVSAYVAARDKGFSPEKSASIAKNLTVNFNRKGANKIGLYYAFFNAAIQGATRMAQTLAGPNGRKIIAGGVALGAVTALAGMLVMGDEWEKIPEFVRERNLIIPLALLGGNKAEYLSWPMPLGYLVFPNIGRKAAEMMLSNTKSKAAHLGDLAGIVAGALSPIGGGDFTQIISPTVADPVIALYGNKDWTGRNIYREDYNSQNPTPGFKRTKDTASLFSKEFAEQINRITGGDKDTQGVLSPTPDQIDYVIGQLTGGAGREALKLEQSVSAIVTGDELPSYKIPLLGRLYGNTEGASGNSGMFYDNIKRLNELNAQVDGRAERNENVDEILDSKEGRLIGYRSAAKTVQKLGVLKRLLKNEGASKDEVKDVDLQIAEVMKGVNEAMSAARR